MQLRPKPDLSQLAREPDVRAAAQAAFDAPPGLGTIASYPTEVALPATGTAAGRVAHPPTGAPAPGRRPSGPSG
ncbi:hypothetical protein [Streptomyces pseudogriseolus]|uniref:hypothetical protein n=1 Tax=Streptomyces pseudogriseolus TaxID=36817 RepID=UPI003FA2643B